MTDALDDSCFAQYNTQMRGKLDDMIASIDAEYEKKAASKKAPTVPPKKTRLEPKPPTRPNVKARTKKSPS